MKRVTLRHFLWLFAITLSSQTMAKSMDLPLQVLTQADSTHAVLEAAIDDSSQLSVAKRFVVVNQLRLRLAAVEMQQGAFDQARNTLRQIETDSPAALQASLLMAESFRLTQQTEQARKWFLRTAHHYPYRVEALHGLVSAAHDEQQRNPGLAAALYGEVSKQSRFALEQLDHYEAPEHLDPMTIIFPSHLDEAVRKTLLRRSLRHPDHNLLTQTDQLKAAVEAIMALQERHQRVDHELSALSQQLKRYQQQRQSLKQQLVEKQRAIARLSEQLIPNDFGPEQTRVRQSLTRLRNQQKRLQAQLSFIEDSQRRLPDIARNLEAQLKALHDKARQQLESSKTAVTDVLEDTVSGYRAQLSDLAAEAQLQRSELRLFKPKSG